MRTSEWINLVTFVFFTALAWFLPNLNNGRRKTILVIGAVALAIVLSAAFAVPVLAPPRPSSIVRDWVPYLLILPLYWQAGQFVTRVDVGFQQRLDQLDAQIVLPLLNSWARSSTGRRILAYLELAYLLCYISVPFGLGALYLIGLRHETEYFWTAVLGATYPCYLLLAFLQTNPPRLVPEKRIEPPKGKLRAFNLWILRKASIHANTFPSAHVASSMACAFIMLSLAPWVGLVFLLIGVSIALGAVAGRYHYAADVITGTLLAAAAFGFAAIARL
jgi:membrane-associated phospholipid phosphatase